jgi:hypothetical protein
MVAMLLATAVAASFPAQAAACRSPLPRGPQVPAPIVFRTSCGAFRLARQGHVTRLPRRWFARHGARAGRRYGTDVQVRRTRPGRIILRRGGRVVWRSAALYPNDATNVAFGPGLFAFSAYRTGIYVTDLRGSERLIVPGRGLYPYDFTSRGELLVRTAPGRVAVVAPGGTFLRTYRFREGIGFTFNGRNLYFVRPDGTLAVAEGARLLSVRTLPRVGGWISHATPGLLVFTAARGVTVTRVDGSLVARAGWRGARLGNFDSGLIPSADGRSFAFRLSNARAGAKSGEAVVYLLNSGASRARAVYRHRLGPAGCAVGATISWHGRFVLYRSIDGQRTLIDGRTARRTDLTALAGALPHLGTETADVHWRSDLR